MNATLGRLPIDRRFRGHIPVARHQSAAAQRLAHLPGVSNPRATSRDCQSTISWCGVALVLLMSPGKVKLFGIGAMAVAVSAEIYSYGVRYLGSEAWSITAAQTDATPAFASSGSSCKQQEDTAS